MKNYGSGNEDRSLMLVYKISKYCFLVMLLIAIPAIVSIREVLRLWLGDVPQFTDVFVVLLLANGLVACLNSGFDALIQASGKIRKNQIGYSLINISLIPIIYVLYKLGCPCYVNVLVMIALSAATILFQCYIMKGISKFQIRAYLQATILPSVLTAILAGIALLLMVKHPTIDVYSLLLNTVLSFMWVMICVSVIGLDGIERAQIRRILTNKLLKNHG